MSAVTPRGQAADACPNSGQGLCPLDRWELLSLITSMRREIGLTDRDVMVLRAHLTVLPQGPLDPSRLNVSFMGVAEILDRACGMDARRFRRGEARLEEVGLIRRRLSANGRRFPERDRSGRIVNAYGIDLAPIFEKHAELLRLKDSLDAERLALRSRKNSLSARLQSLLRHLTASAQALPDWADALRQTLRNVLRRSTTRMEDLDQIETQLQQLEADTETPVDSFESVVPCSPPCPSKRYETVVSPDRKPADAGQSVRHIESEPKDIKNTQHLRFDKKRIARLWAETKSIQALYPEIPQTERSLANTLFQFSSFIGLRHDSVTHSLSSLGWNGMIPVLDYLSENITGIAHPDRYLLTMIKSFQAGHPIANGSVVPKRLERLSARNPVPV
ncbi:MAG: helix-turn-helix domain-containing protein [Rhodobacterales bacterium]|uniref:helix-turn-helix domain-containing protein n=1 Tax=Puniceibacterium antarcticum TaxID=1206336 RepID=UPI0015D47390|nr:helix-turn-helix domain-containing protein [Puniceibacterium antarcticum]